MRGSQGGGGGQGDRTPLEIHKAMGFFSNTGPEPLENHKTTKPAFNVRPHHRPASETSFKFKVRRTTKIRNRYK